MIGNSQSLGSLVLELNANAAGYFAVFRQVEQTTNTTMGNVAGAVKTAGVAMAAAMAGVAAITVREFTKFESSFAGVRKTVNATELEFARLESGLRDMSKQIPVNVNEINRIGEAAGQLGIKTQNLVSFTRVMADLGVATNMTSEQAATQLARLANITQMSQTNFDRLGASIVALGNNFATTEAEITEMSLRIAGAGHQVGMTEADIVGFAAALSSVGVEAHAGGSSISRIMIAMSKAVADGGEKLGLFAAVARMTAEDFQAQFRDNAAKAVTKFIEGLKDTADAGNDVFKVLTRLDIDDIRLTDALLRAAGAGKLFDGAIKLANTAWKQNTALTDEATKRYATFESQASITLNLLRDIAITIGGQLAPVLGALNVMLQDVLRSFGDVNGGATAFGSFLRDSLVTTIGVVADAFYGWRLVMKHLEMAIVGLMGVWKFASLTIQLAVTTVSGVVEAVFRGWQKLFYTTIGGIKIYFGEFAVWAKTTAIEVARWLNKILPEKNQYDDSWFTAAVKDLEQWKKNVQGARTELENNLAKTSNDNLAAQGAIAEELAQFVKDIAQGTDEFTLANEGLKKEIAELAAQPLPSERIAASFNTITQASNSAGQGVADMSDKIQAALAEFFGPLDQAQQRLEVLNGTILELRDTIKQPWQDALPALEKYKKLLDDGKIAQWEFNAAIRAMGFTQDISSPLADNLNRMLDVERRIAALAQRGISTNPYERQQTYNNLVAGSSPFVNPLGTSVTGAQLASPITGAGASQLMQSQQMQAQFNYELEMIRSYYDTRKTIEVGAVEQIEQEKQRVLREMQANMATLQQHFALTTAQNIVQVFQNSFDQLAEFARTVAGEQSGIYKAMFFVSRATAAAMAAVNAFVAYTNALAFIPPPYNIPIAKFALASGLAASAAILGTAIASFDGGGQVADGPRIGGVDGRGGKLAVVHPREKIGLDEQLAGSGGSEVTININNYTEGQVETRRSQDGKTVDIIIRRAVNKVADDIRTGGGPVSAALESSFRVSRGRG